MKRCGADFNRLRLRLQIKKINLPTKNRKYETKQFSTAGSGMLYCLAQFPEIMLPEMWKIDLIFTLVGLFNWSRPAPPVRFFFSFYLQPNLGLMFSYFICTMYGMHGAISRLSAHSVGRPRGAEIRTRDGWI